MSGLTKILLVLFLAALAGLVIFLSVVDVHISQTEITTEIPYDSLTKSQ